MKTLRAITAVLTSASMPFAGFAGMPGIPNAADLTQKLPGGGVTNPNPIGDGGGIQQPVGAPTPIQLVREGATQQALNAARWLSWRDSLTPDQRRIVAAAEEVHRYKTAVGSQQASLRDMDDEIRKLKDLAALRGRLIGKTDCKAGDPDCNPCANDVEATMKAYAEGNSEYFQAKEKTWKLNYTDRFRPLNLKSQPFFDASGVTAPHHFQGFVKTNHPEFMYAGSHSAPHGKKGAIFVVRQDPEGRKRLNAIFPASGEHPGGVAPLGRYVVVGDPKPSLRMIDLTRLDDDHNLYFTPPKGRSASDPQGGLDGGGGGLAMIKLAGGRYLLAATNPGSSPGLVSLFTQPGKTIANAEKPRVTRFWEIAGDLDRCPKGLTKGDLLDKGCIKWIRLVGESRYTQPVTWNGYYGWSENMSMVTECRTGSIYTIHTTGDEVGGQGYWRLSKVVLDKGMHASSNEVVLRTLPNVAKQNSDVDSCYMRASATVHVTAGHKMHFVCHERAVARNGDGACEFGTLGLGDCEGEETDDVEFRVRHVP